MSQLFQLLQTIADEEDVDLFLFSGKIDVLQANALVDAVEESHDRENVGLFLCTGGGDPDAAYTIARCLQRRYEKFTLYIFGYCKSAGTLIALGADEIVMSAHGELGPLDVQLVKRDELLFSSSGLDLLQAMESLKARSLDIFETHFLELIEKSGGSITIKTAADIASKITGDVLAPITGQIDPLRLGEVERAIEIASEYGLRLSGDLQKVETLIHNFPSHGFVIDFEEASEIFGNVRMPTEAEIEIKKLLAQQLREKFGRDHLRLPKRDAIVAKLNPIAAEKAEEKANENQQNTVDEQSDENGHHRQSEQAISSNSHTGTDRNGDAETESKPTGAEAEEFRAGAG